MSEARWPRYYNGPELGEPRVKPAQAQILILLPTRRGELPTDSFPFLSSQNEAVPDARGLSRGQPLLPGREAAIMGQIPSDKYNHSSIYQPCRLG